MNHPKVRFSQFLETFAKQEKIEKTRYTSSKGKVKIKSIIPINFPIKVLKGGKTISRKNQEDKNDNSKIIEQNLIEGKYDNVYKTNKRTDIYNNTSISPSIFKSHVIKPLEVDANKSSSVLKSKLSTLQYYQENQNTQTEDDKRNNDLSKVQSRIDKLKRMDIKDSLIELSSPNLIEEKNNISDKHIHTRTICNELDKKHISSKTCDGGDEDSDIEIVEIINTSIKPIHVHNINKKKSIHDIDCNMSNINSKLKNENKFNIFYKLNKDKASQKDNKENYYKSVKSNKEKNDLVTFSTTKILKDTTNATPQLHKNCVKKNMRVQNKIQFIPHEKFKRLSSNNRNLEKLVKTQVKKSIMFHAAGDNSNIHVESAAVSKNNTVNNNNDLIKVSQRKNTLCKDLLSHPEYNSTISVMKKLKGIETEKSITDLKYLSPMHKKCLYDKISAALDFAPYESVYKDLINLSIDDKLPTKLMRSKDPQPRDKDIVPKLSDFYNPKYTEQYFVIVNPTAPNPVNMDVLNAFTISNRICTWKISRDNF